MIEVEVILKLSNKNIIRAKKSYDSLKSAIKEISPLLEKTRLRIAKDKNDKKYNIPEILVVYKHI